MRAFLAIVLAAALAWTAYLASPYWAAWRLASALEARDARRVEERVNLRAVRQSLARQLVSEGLQSKAVAAALGGSDAQVAAGTIAAAADPVLERIVTPEGVIALLPPLRQDETKSIDRPRERRGFTAAVRDAWSFALASRWRGFRNVYLTLPPEAEPDRQVRLQLRLSRFKWRLIGIDLPPATRLRLVGDMVRLHGGARTE